jgi:hypothetical protein
MIIAADGSLWWWRWCLVAPLEVVVASCLPSDYLAQHHCCLHCLQGIVEGVPREPDWPVGDFDFCLLALGWPVTMDLCSGDQVVSTPSELVVELVMQPGLRRRLVWLSQPQCW